jgi:hypothetical protein
MSEPQVLRSHYTVDIEARCQPELLMPHVLGGLGLLSPKEMVAARIEVCAPGFVRYTVPWADVVVTTTQLHFELTDERKLEPLFDMIMSLSQLGADEDEPRSPLSGPTEFELLRGSHFKVPTKAHAGGKLVSVLNQSALRKELKPKSLERLAFNIDAGDTGATSLRLTIEPSRQPPAWIYVESLATWSCRTDSSGSKQLDLLRIVSDHWAQAVDISDAHLRWVMDDLRSLWEPRTRKA